MTWPTILLATDGGGFGGAEIALYEAARSLVRLGHRVHLLVGRPDVLFQALLEDGAIDGVEVHSVSEAIGTRPVAALSSRLRRAAAKRVETVLSVARPDAVIVNLHALWGGAAVLDAVRSRPDSTVVAGFLQLAHPPSVLGARLGSLRDRLIPRHLSRFDLLLSVARSQETALRRLGVRTPCVHVGQPVATGTPATAMGRADARRALGVDGEVLVGLIGRVVLRHKGHDDAVEIARRLRELGSPARWVIVGDGPDLPALRELVHDSGLSDLFYFSGWRNDAGRLVEAFDAVVLPSRYEGLPLTAVEAISAGVPVVGYAVDGINDLLDSPFAVPPGDKAAFAAALSGLLSRPETWPAEQMLARARSLCDPQAVAARMVAALAQPGLRAITTLER